MNGLRTRLSRRRVGAIVSLLFLLRFAVGCVYIPGPEWTVIEGQRLNADQLAFIKAGETDRARIEEQLGPPPYYWVDFQTMIYHWRVENGIFVVGAPGGGAAGITTKEYLLLIQLDPANRVRRYGIIGGDPLTLGFFNIKSRRERIRQWLASGIDQEAGTE